MGLAGLDGINLAHYRNSVIKFPKMRGIFWIAEELVISEKGHCSMQLVIATLFFAVSYWYVLKRDFIIQETDFALL
jgi:hypothetical protein